MAPKRPTGAEAVELILTHAQVDADTSSKEWKVPAGRKFRITGARLLNPTGLAAHASNYFNIKLQNGSTVIANWSTQSSAQGALSADTFVDMVLSGTDGHAVLAPGDVLSLNLDLTGTQTLPAGRVCVSGYFVPGR